MKDLKSLGSFSIKARPKGTSRVKGITTKELWGLWFRV